MEPFRLRGVGKKMRKGGRGPSSRPKGCHQTWLAGKKWRFQWENLGEIRITGITEGFVRENQGTGDISSKPSDHTGGASHPSS